MVYYARVYVVYIIITIVVKSKTAVKVFRTVQRYLAQQGLVNSKEGMKVEELGRLYFTHRNMPVLTTKNRIARVLSFEYFQNPFSPIYRRQIEWPVHLKKAPVNKPKIKKEKVEIPTGKQLTKYEKYKKYLKSKKWRNFSSRIKAQRGHKCEVCGAKGKGVELHAHHLTYERLYNEQPEDIQILCNMCHKKVHNITPR